LDPTAALEELLAGCGPAANGIVFQWRAAMLEEGRSPSTVNRRLAALRSVVGLARLVGRMPWSLEVRGVKAEVLRDTHGPAPRAVRRVRRLLEAESRSRRDTALLRLLVDVGLQRAEILSLDLEHVDAERGGLWVMRKGKRQRTWLDLPAAAAAAVAAWVGE
jgi:integrase/recombinase XerC